MTSSSAGPLRPTIYVCDPSAEATRIESALSQAGYEVVDVPRHRLVDRVRLERPAAVVLDVAEEATLSVVSQIRATNGGEGVHVLFVASRGGPLRDAEDALMRDGSGLFLRPVDPSSLVRKIEALVGPGDVSRERQPRPRAPVQNAPEDLPSGRSLEAQGPGSILGRESSLPELADDIRSMLAAADARAAKLDLSGAAPPLDGEGEIDLILGGDDLSGIAPAEEAAGSEGDLDDGRSVTSGAHTGSGRTKSEDERVVTQGPAQVAKQRRTTASHAVGAAQPTGTRSSTTPGYRGTPNTPAARLAASDDPAKSIRDAALAMPRIPSLSPREGIDSSPVPTPSIATPALSSAHLEAFAGAPRAFVSEPPVQTATLPPEAPVALASLPPLLAERTAPGLVAGLLRRQASGVLTFSEDGASRSLTLRDGDISAVQSTYADDSLLALLDQRGLVSREALGAMSLSPVPRLACAALVARGFLAQDDLWPALRLHGEHVIRAMLSSSRGAVAFVEGRLADDGPSPFGALSGGAVFVRCFCLAREVSTFRDRAARRPFQLAPGPRFEERDDVLGGADVAHDLSPFLHTPIDAQVGERLDSALVTLEALAHLDFLTVVDRIGGEENVVAASSHASAAIDADALRQRITARRKLVDEADYFALLGLSPRANAFEVRQAYLEFRRAFEPARVLQHPELLALEADLRTVLAVVEEAYHVLRDDARRDRYRRAIGAAAS
jgi:hypothetical protein